MTDPTEIQRALEAVADAFEYGHGEPGFEPGIDSSADADEGTVTLQKACRLLASAERTDDETDFYTSVVEHSFAAMERSIEGYLIRIAGDDPSSLRDHVTPYERARAQVPLEDDTIGRIEQLYESNRTTYYYGTSVATARQAGALLDLAWAVHDHLVGFDGDLGRSCICDT